VIRRIVFFVPFQAFVLALVLMPFEYPAWLAELLKRLGGTLIPLALVSVGYQLRLSAVRGKVTALATGLLFKLALAPALILILFAGIFGAEGQTMRVTVFEAAMADDRREHRRHGSRSRPAASHAYARCRHPPVIFDAAGMAVSAHPRVNAARLLMALSGRLDGRISSLLSGQKRTFSNRRINVR
jgi:hypothetical protein